MQRKIELLAPAKSFEAMITAYKAGADAVYAGGQKFSARAYATNFNEEEIIEAIRVSHLFGKKFYLAVNTLVKEFEIQDSLYSYIEKLYINGLDACIIQDIGVFSFLKKYFPSMDLHISTQASITNKKGAGFFHDLGASRIVTAREMNLKEIQAIRKIYDIEIESFIHGALCYCYSGQCMFSSMLGERSGNRGRCAQPCRLPYDIYDFNGNKLNKNKIYPLSLKDMCTVENIPQLLSSGITSLKIEGRMKSLEYLATVTSIYRKYIDMYLRGDDYIVDKVDIQKLLDIYNRGGFSGGYYNDKLKNMVSIHGNAKQDVSKSAINRLESIKKEVEENYLSKKLLKPIDIYFYAKPGEKFSVTVSCDDNYITEYGDEVQIANSSSGNEYIEKSICSLGNTYFKVRNYYEEIDGNIFIPVKSLKDCRRRIIDKIMNSNNILRNDLNKFEEIPYTAKIKNKNSKISVSINNVDQFKTIIKFDNIDRIYYNIATMNIDQIKECINISNKENIIELSAIYNEEIDIINFSVDGVLIKNFEQWEYYKDAKILKILNHNIYTANSYAINFAKENGIDEVFMPIEITKKESNSIIELYDNVVVYGYLPVMITKQDTSTVVKNRNNDIILKDRKNVEFIAQRMSNNTYTAIYNSVPLNIAEYYDGVNKHFDFTNETPDKIEDILGQFVKKGKLELDKFTRAHVKNPIK